MHGPASATSLRRYDPAAIALCLIALGATIVYPTARLLLGALAEWAPETLNSANGRAAIWNTVWMGFASVICSGIVGTALALFISRFRFPGRRTLSAMAFLPFALPPLVGTLSFYYLIGSDGFIPRFLERFGWDDASLAGGAAVLVIHTYSFFVFFYAMVSAALENLDTSQIEAARTLGASPGLAFRKVTLPMLTPALVGASLLTFMSSGASFSAPLYFGGDEFPYLSVEIFEARTSHDQALAMSYTVLLAAISLMGIAVFRSRRRRAGAASKGAARPIRSQSGRILAGVAAWALVLLLLTPHFVIVLLSFANHFEWYTELVPPRYTLENYKDIFTEYQQFRPILNSLWMAFLGALATLAVGLPAGYLIGRHRPGARWINFLVMIPWALPGTVVAINLIAAFNDPWLPLYNTVWLLPVAYFVRSVPLLTRMSTAAITQFDATLLEAGRTLGAGPGFLFRHVIFPLIAPAVVAAGALVFATSLGEFVASILLYTNNNVPIAVEIHQQWRGSGIGTAFAYGVFLMLLVTATFLFSRRFASRII